MKTTRCLLVLLAADLLALEGGAGRLGWGGKGGR